MQRWVVSSLLIGAMFVGAARAGENWPQFRGPDGDGHAGSVKVPTSWNESENIAWKTPIRGLGWSSPVIWKNQIWLTSATPDGHEMYAICVDKTTGAVLLDKKLFDVSEPREIHATNTYASPTPVIEDGRVYVHFGSYGTACLDTASFEVLWTRRDLPCHHWRGPGSSPILFENLLIVHFDGYDYQYIVALDKQTGDTVWRTDRDIDFGTENGDFMKAYATPTLIEVNGQTQLVSPASKAVLAYDPRTGEEIWRVRFNEFSATARPIFAHGLVYISTGFGKAQLYAIRPDGRGDVTETHVAWAIKRGVPSKPSMLIVDDLLYMVHDAGVATCVDAKSGEVVWQERLKGQFSASLLYVDGKIHFNSHDGETTVILPGNEYQAVAVNNLGNGPDQGFRASPAVSENALFLRTKTHLYRIETTR